MAITPKFDHSRFIQGTGILKTSALRKDKASAKATMMACYDQDGALVGLIDPDDLTPVAAPPKTAAPKTAAPAPAEPAPAEQVADTVAKSLSGATFTKASVASFTKGAGGTVDDRFEALVKSLDTGHSEALRSAVVLSSLQLMGRGQARSSAAAISACKAVALNVAAAAAR